MLTRRSHRATFATLRQHHTCALERTLYHVVSGSGLGRAGQGRPHLYHSPRVLSASFSQQHGQLDVRLLVEVRLISFVEHDPNNVHTCVHRDIVNELQSSPLLFSHVSACTPCTRKRPTCAKRETPQCTSQVHTHTHTHTHTHPHAKKMSTVAQTLTVSWSRTEEMVVPHLHLPFSSDRLAKMSHTVSVVLLTSSASSAILPLATWTAKRDTRYCLQCTIMGMFRIAPNSRLGEIQILQECIISIY